MTRILLIEDDERIREPLLRVLRNDGFDVIHSKTGDEGLQILELEMIDVLLLDLTLPDIDGLDVCRRARDQTPDLPIIMLTARAEEIDVVVGLGAGADDYVAKPFRMAELVARIHARLRVAELEDTTTMMIGSLYLNVHSRRVFLDGDEIELAPKEFDVLALLMSEPDTVFSRERLIKEVWGEQYWGSGRTLDTHISTLRRKLGDSIYRSTYIITVRGIGFRMGG